MSIARQLDGKVLIGGFFDTVAGVTRHNVARLNADGSLDGSFDPGWLASGTPGFSPVYSVAFDATAKVVIGGGFTSINGVARPYVARLLAGSILLITGQPGSRTNSVGSTATFSITGVGVAPLGYQWRFNGSDIPGATSASYTLPGVQFADAGNFDCVFSDASGSVTSQVAVLTVQATLTTAVVGGGTVCVSPDLEVYTTNTFVSLTAIPDAGWTFNNWSSGGSLNPLVITLTNNVFVTANFSAGASACTPPPPGLISWWTANADAGDVIGGNHGALLGGATFASAKAGKGFSFDGVDDGVVVADNASLDFGAAGSFTVEGWVSIGGISAVGEDAVLDKRGADLIGYTLELVGPPATAQRHFEFSIRGFDSGGALKVSSDVVADADFHHLAGVVNRGTHTMALYLDGVLQQTADISGVASLANSGRLFIGHQTVDATTGLRPFRGTVDELSLYGRALSSPEIQALYSAGGSGKCRPVVPPPLSGLVSWWSAEGNANDIISMHNGTAQGAVAFVAGRAGQAFDLPGGSSGIAVLDVSDLKFASQFSIEAWIRPDPADAPPDGEVRTIFGRFGASKSYRLCLVRFNAQWQLELHVSANGSSFWGPPALGSLTLPAGWTHVAGTFENGAMRIFINGTQAYSGAGYPIPLFTGATVAPFIGGEPVGNHGFRGQIDEVTVCNRALTPFEIQQIYTLGGSGKCALPPNIFPQPASQTNRLGTTVTFSVGAASITPLAYQWQFGGTDIPGATSSSYTRSNLQLGDAGSYAVMVSSGGGVTPSSNAVLTVADCSLDSIAPATLTSAVVETSYNSSFSGINTYGQTAFSVSNGALPAGLSFSQQGLLSGTPLTHGTFPFSVSVEDAVGCTATRDYSMRVYPANTRFAAQAQLNRSIPPVGTGGTSNPAQDIASSSIFVSGVNTQWAKCITVGLDLEHSRDSDLVITLTPPGGSALLLANRRGGNGSNYTATFFRNHGPLDLSQEAAPFTGTFRAEVLLAFSTHNGEWKLEIEDKAGGNTGVLLNWWVSFQAAPSYPETNVLLWSAALNSSAVSMVVDSGLAQSLHQTYVQQANRLSAFRNTDGVRAWERTGTFPGRLALLDGQSTELLIVASASGFVQGLRPSDGASFWGTDTRRGSCPSDSLSAAPVVQVRRFSDPAFRSARSNDLVFVATDYECSSTTANRVLALDGLTGAQVWNSVSLGLALDRGTGLAVDYSRNTVFCTFDKTVAGSQTTVLALGTTNGIPRWQRDVGAVQSQPLLANGAVYVGAKNGTIYKLNPNSGLPFWTNGIFPAGVTLTNDLAFDAERNRVLVTGSDGRFFALNDLGVSTTLAWSNNLSGALAASTAVLAPAFDKVYAGSRTGRVYQVNAVNGQVEGFGTFGFNGPMFQLIGDSDDGGPAITRLLGMGASGVVRASIPWGLAPVDKGGVISTPATQLALGGTLQPGGVTAVGDPVTYTLTVQNFGPAAAGYVTLWDTLPVGLAFRSATVSQGTFCISGSEFVAELGPLLASSQTTISLVVTSSLTGLFQHTAAIGGYYRDSFPGDNSTLISHVVGVVPPPSLAIERSGESVSVSWPTSALGYTLTCNTNLGSSDWLVATPAPQVVNGRYTVTNAITGSNKFYRLRKP